MKTISELKKATDEASIAKWEQIKKEPALYVLAEYRLSHKSCYMPVWSCPTMNDISVDMRCTTCKKTDKILGLEDL